MNTFQYLKCLFFIVSAILLSCARFTEAQLTPLYYNIERVVDYKWQNKQRNNWNINAWAGGKGGAHFSDLWSGSRSILAFEGSLYLSYIRKNIKYTVDSINQKKEIETAYGAELDLFYKFFGLGGRYSQVSEPSQRLKDKYAEEEIIKRSNKHIAWEAALKIRALGNSLQSTHINIFAGKKRLRLITPDSEVIDYNPIFGGLTSSIYFNLNFGLLLGYDYSFRENNKEKLVSVWGSGYYAGIFAEYRALRMRAVWLEQEFQLDRINSNVKIIPGMDNSKKMYGIEAGIQLFF